MYPVRGLFVFLLAAGCAATRKDVASTTPAADAGPGSAAPAGERSQSPGAPSGRSSSDKDRVIDHVLDAHGGWARLSTIASYRADGTVTAHMRGGTGMVTRTFFRPDRLRVVIDYGDRREIRMVAGERGMRGGDDNALAPAFGPALAAMQLQAARAALPWLLADRRGEVRVAGRTGPTGTEKIQLDINVAPGLLLEIVVDAHTGLIDSTRGRVEANPAVQFEARYRDYRSFDGVRLPVVEENFASGMHTATTIIDTVRLNLLPAGGQEV